MDGVTDEVPTAGFARYDSGRLTPLCEDHMMAASRITETVSLEDGEGEFTIQLVMEG